MESTESISKGCFVFKNGFTRKKSKIKRKSIQVHFLEEPWHKSYNYSWSIIYKRIKDLRHSLYMNILQGLTEFIKYAHEYDSELPLPAAVLITGINQADHAGQFNGLAREMKLQVTPHVATLFARDCPNVKSALENMTMQLISEMDEIEHKPIRRYQCNLLVLQSRYEYHYNEKRSWSPTKKAKKKYNRKPIVVIIPDFECFNTSILQDFILLLSSYITSLPFVLLFGVATSLSTVHKTLPHHVTSKMSIQIFRSQPSLDTLHQILNQIILDPSCPFHLSGPLLKFLTDVFLFYDFSAEGFINNFKFCMMQHYSNSSLSVLCDFENSTMVINELSTQGIELIRRLPSFRPYVESQHCQQRINLLTDDKSVRDILLELITDIKDYTKLFHLHLKILHQLTNKLPQALLGKQLYELYVKAMSTNITEGNDFNECMHLLSFLSKSEFLDRIHNIIQILQNEMDKNKDDSRVFNAMLEVLLEYQRELKSDNILNNINNQEINDDFSLTSNVSRKEMRELLLERSKQKKPITQYELVRKEILTYLCSNFKKYLYPANAKTLPLYELFFFSDLDNVKEHIVGTPRAALHTALNNPNYYLQCSCCVMESKDSIVSSMPDICIAYKLHLECGRLINLYDWLQAFRSVLVVNNLNKQNENGGENDDDADDHITQIEPEIQARFTNCVVELQHLGFIKSSNRKADHVTRLTW